MSSADELLELAIEAHGGRERWGSVADVSADLEVGGLLLAQKGRRGAFDRRVVVSATEPRSVFRDYAGPGVDGIFERGDVRCVNRDGDVVAERSGARLAFFGRLGLRRRFRWDELDALYFGGYASWNYLTTPFMLDGEEFGLSEGAPREVDGKVCRRLDVEFPIGVDTHSRTQSFFFDDRGLLRRLDYTAEIVGSFARAVHLCREHREVGGIVFPTRRRVLLRGLGGRAVPGISVVTIALSEIQVSEAGAIGAHA